jgi:hypothetical protein
MATQTMTTANKELVEEFIDRVFNEHNADATGTTSAPMCSGTEARWERLADPMR